MPVAAEMGDMVRKRPAGNARRPGRWRTLPGLLCAADPKIAQDVKSYLWALPASEWTVRRGISVLLTQQPSFRNVLYYRARARHPWLVRLSSQLLPPRPGVEIEGKIGGGLCLFHADACHLAPSRAGCWLTVCRGGWIGADDAGNRPVLGDGVTVRAFARLTGGIRVGDGAVIDTGAQVDRDVPPRCLATGSPASFFPLEDEPADGFSS